MSEWTTVVRKKYTKKPLPKESTPVYTSDKPVAPKKRTTTSTKKSTPPPLEKRYTGGVSRPVIDPRKLEHEEDIESYRLPQIDRQTALKIQQARQAKGMSQADLAKAIKEKPQVVNSYENAKAIPDRNVLIKMEAVLGIKLVGKKQKKRM